MGYRRWSKDFSAKRTCILLFCPFVAACLAGELVAVTALDHLWADDIEANPTGEVRRQLLIYSLFGQQITALIGVVVGYLLKFASLCCRDFIERFNHLLTL